MGRGGWIMAGIGAALGVELLLARPARASRGRVSLPAPGGVSYPSGVPMADTLYTETMFRPIVERFIATTYPRIAEPFAMTWGRIESGWNPCAVGDPGQLGPDGQPAEIGLGQLYNPDDFRAFKLDPATFRAYAPAAAPLANAYRQAKVDRDAAKARGDQISQAAAQGRMNEYAREIQSRTRALSPQEMDDQVHWTLLAKIAQCMTVADRTVAMDHLAWSLPDYWKLVKAPHALPVILGNGMPAVVKKLGRAPVSWAEFRQVLGMDGNDQWHRALNACEECGNAVAPAVA